MGIKFNTAMMLVSAIGYFVTHLSAKTPEYTLQRTVRYSYTLKNDSAKLLLQASFSTYAPVKLTATQRVDKLEASHPYELIVDDNGNQIMRFQVDNLPPYANEIIRITAQLSLAESPNEQRLNDEANYLTAERYIEKEAPEIQTIAKTINMGNRQAIAKQSYQWAADNVQYFSYIRDDRGALYALKNKKGDCTESMYLFSALARANQVPTRGLGGYRMRENGILHTNDYHNWAEFYENNTWWIADPQNKVFAEKASEYIAMRIIHPASTSPLRNTHRFAYAGEGLSVKMN